MRVLALAKAYYPDMDVTKLTGGFPEFNLDKSKFDSASFQKIDRNSPCCFCHLQHHKCWGKDNPVPPEAGKETRQGV